MSYPRIVVKLSGFVVLDLSPLELLLRMSRHSVPTPGQPLVLEIRTESNVQAFDCGLVEYEEWPL